MKEKELDFGQFVQRCNPSLALTPFHEKYYRVLDSFARGRVRKLMVTMPPQHGKSSGASILLPAYLLGLNPDSKVVISSYSAKLASRLNRRVQRVVDSPVYGDIFPQTTIKKAGAKNDAYVRTATQAEVIGHAGEVFSVGREGSLTGNQVDIIILDDLYKDAMEANSPVIRDNCWEWYTSVVKTRLHNDSSELIVFTRWHEDDLVGRIAAKEKVVELTSWPQLEDCDEYTWMHLHFDALKEGPTTELDPRGEGEALWPERHSRERLLAARNLDPQRFEALYQGRPAPREGLLYGEQFRTYGKLPDDMLKKGNYTDSADMGDDYLCSVCYEVDREGMIYVTDVVYSRERMEVTEKLVSCMVEKTGTRSVLVESNNGGRGFALAVGRLTSLARIHWFHQSGNKEARIISNSATVLRNIVMPEGWERRWPEFYAHLTGYRRQFASNRWHDAPDVLTGIIEYEVLQSLTKKVRAVGFS